MITVIIIVFACLMLFLVLLESVIQEHKRYKSKTSKYDYWERKLP